MKYQIIYADPPWRFWAGGDRNAIKHYPCMRVEDIYKLPISDLADDNCALFLWATMPLLPEAFECIKAWGFHYSTCAFSWMKLNENNMGVFMGCGYWTRANAELCLLATKGKLKRQSACVPQAIVTPIGKHSRKPDEVIRPRILELLGDLPRVELFARRKVEGWDAWGNEVESDIELSSLMAAVRGEGNNAKS
jgi:N6-adenosine-specific RNA methylase IME4